VLHPERPKRDLQEVRDRHERNTRSRRSSLEFLSAECRRSLDQLAAGLVKARLTGEARELLERIEAAEARWDVSADR